MNRLYHQGYHIAQQQNEDSHGARLLKSKSTPSPAPTITPTDPDDGLSTTSAPSGINNLASEFRFRWVVCLCLGLLAGYVSFKLYRFLIRRRRILRSEQAGGMLGDLQMLPNDDFSDHIDYNDNDAGEVNANGEEHDSELL